jgi:small multidrug resistance pump/multidrug resistance protein EbrA
MGIPRVYWYVLLIVLLETLAMSCFKRSIDNSAFFAVGVLFYAAVGYLLRLTMNTSGMAMTNALWSGLSVMATTTVGIMLFKESIHFHDLIAIALIVSGVMILKVTD